MIFRKSRAIRALESRLDERDRAELWKPKPRGVPVYARTYTAVEVGDELVVRAPDMDHHGKFVELARGKSVDELKRQLAPAIVTILREF